MPDRFTQKAMSRWQGRRGNRSYVPPICAIALGFAVIAGAQETRRKLPNLDKGLPYTPPHAPTRECRTQDWAMLNLPQTKTLLTDYGYEEYLPWTCETIDIPWLTSARIIRLHAIVQLDDYRDVTLIQANPTSRVWLIPTYFGMVGFPNNENNPHNMAAFNDLLRVAALKATDSQLIDLGNLYQSILHMDEWVDPERAPKTAGDAQKIDDIEFMTQHDAHGTTLTHRERFGDSFSHTYMVWEFYFTSTGASTRLSRVTRQTIEKYHEDN